MTLRRFAYTMGGLPLPEPIEVGADYQSHVEHVPVMTDRHHEGNRAPDGADIGSRQKRRDWMRATGSADSTDFSPDYYARKRQERANPIPGLHESIRAAYNRRK
jgi:hypothetical protein